MDKASLRSRSLLWMAGSATGAFIVALPDSGERVFSLSETHGPSPLDLFGVIVLIGSWLPVAVLMPRMWRAMDSGRRRTLGALAIAGAIALLITIGYDLGWTWLMAVAALVAVQILLVANAWREAGRNSRIDN